MKKMIKNSLFVLLFVISWDLLHHIFNINSVILPSFYEILISFLENIGDIFKNLVVTLLEASIGIIVTILLSLVIAILINENRILKKFFLKFIYIFQMIPLIAIAPLFIIWLGIGIISKIVLIILYCSFSIIVTTLSAFENISNSHKLYILSLTRNKFSLYKYLYLPMSYEQIFSGIKIAVTYSVVCAITGEYIGAKSGLGILLNRAYSGYQTDLVFALIIIIILATLLLLKVVDIFEKRLRS